MNGGGIMDLLEWIKQNKVDYDPNSTGTFIEFEFKSDGEWSFTISENE